MLKNLGSMGNIGAGDEIRTHDILVGNEMLYTSYARMLHLLQLIAVAWDNTRCFNFASIG